MDNWISRRWVCPYFYLLSIIRKLIHWNVWRIKKLKKRISIQNNDNKCFLWCYIRHLNQLKIHLERITKADRRMVNNLDYVDIKFPVSKKDYWGRFRGGHEGRVSPPSFSLNRLFFASHFEELQTVFIEVKLIINNALLTYVCPNTIKTYLTPNYLLFGRQLL